MQLLGMFVGSLCPSESSTAPSSGGNLEQQAGYIKLKDRNHLLAGAVFSLGLGEPHPKQSWICVLHPYVDKLGMR